MRICFVGDSFVNGTGDPECLGWAGRICAAARQDGHDVTYYNLGVRRETSADIRDRWYREVTVRFPSGENNRIVFSFGVNDTTLEAGQHRVAPEASIANARDILRTAAQMFPTLMVSPLPVSDEAQNHRIAHLSAQFAEVCQDLQVPYLNAFSTLVKDPIWIEEAIANDGAHPLAGGYAAMAELVQNWSAWREWWS